MLNAFVANDKRKVVSIYNDFMAMNEDEMRILNAFQGKIEEILYTKKKVKASIIVTNKMIITVCLEDTQVLTRFMEGRVRNFFTNMKTRFILQILYRVSTRFLFYLKQIDRMSSNIEKELHNRNKTIAGMYSHAEHIVRSKVHHNQL